MFRFLERFSFSYCFLSFLPCGEGLVAINYIFRHEERGSTGSSSEGGVVTYYVPVLSDKRSIDRTDLSNPANRISDPPPIGWVFIHFSISCLFHVDIAATFHTETTHRHIQGASLYCLFPPFYDLSMLSHRSFRYRLFVHLSLLVEFAHLITCAH